jgi:hypothetical protein
MTIAMKHLTVCVVAFSFFGGNVSMIMIITTIMMCEFHMQGNQKHQLIILCDLIVPTVVYVLSFYDIQGKDTICHHNDQ